MPLPLEWARPDEEVLAPGHDLHRGEPVGQVRHRTALLEEQLPVHGTDGVLPGVEAGGAAVVNRAHRRLEIGVARLEVGEHHVLPRSEDPD